MKKQGFDQKGKDLGPRRSSGKGQTWEKRLEEAVRLHKQNKVSQAEAIYSDLARQGYRHPALIANYGVALKQLGKAKESLELLTYAAALNSDHANTLANLAQTQKETGKLLLARENIERAIALNPLEPVFLRIQAAVLEQLGLYDECLSTLERAIEQGDRHVELACMRVLCLIEVGREEEGRLKLEELYERKDLGAYDLTRLGRAHLTLGNTEVTRRLVESALEQESWFVPALILKSQAQREPLNGEEISALEEASKALETGTTRARLLFVLGKEHEKLKRFKRAFKYWKKANDMKLSHLPGRELDEFWKNGERQLRAEEIIRNKGEEYGFKPDLRGRGRIFIVGMPRSGSTLLETIIGRVGRYAILGESKAFGQSLWDVLQNWRHRKGIEGKVSVFDMVSADEMESLFIEIADRYGLLSNTKGDDKENGIIYSVDKMLFNYQNIPMLARTFPGCKIINVHRCPLDNILSMYKEDFNEGNEFTYSLSAMVKVYDKYTKIIHRSKQLFPCNVLDCSYDEYVAKPEVVLKGLFSDLGIEWSEEYIDGGRERSIIRTASIVQARNKINSASIGKWKNYSLELETVRKMLLEKGYDV